MRNLKRKVALLLAVVMMLAMVPAMNVFGASGIRVDSLVTRTEGDGTNEVFRGITVRFPITAAMVPGAGVNEVTVGGGSVVSPTAIQLIPTGERAGYTQFNPTGGTVVVNLLNANNTMHTPGIATYSGVRPAGQPLTLPTAGITNVHVGMIAEVVFDVSAREGAGFTLIYASAATPGPYVNPWLPRTVTVLTNSLIANPRVVGAGFTIAAMATTNLVPTVITGLHQEAQDIGGVRITERQALNFGNSISVRLQAPANYNWVNYTNLNVRYGGGFSVVGEASDITVTGSLSGTNNQFLTVTIPTSASRAPGGVPGVVELTEMRLVPATGHVPFPQDLNVLVRVNYPVWDHHNANLTLARQTQRGVSAPALVGDMRELRTGALDPVWTEPIRFVESGPRALQEEFSLLVSSLHPGVIITGAQWRTYIYGAADYRISAFDNAFSRNVDGWTGTARGAGEIISDRTEALFRIFRDINSNVNYAGTNRRRVVEFRLQVVVEPGAEHRFDIDPVLSVDVRGIGAMIEGTVAATVNVATLRDPITVTAEDPAEIPFGEHAIGVALNQRLADVTITETATARLAPGAFIDVFVVPMLAGQPVSLPIAGAGMTFTAPTGITEGTNNLRLARVMTPADFAFNGPHWPEHAVGGVRFNVNRASTGEAGSITIDGLFLTGAMWNFPGIEFAIVVGGNSVRGWRHPLSLNRPVAPGEVLVPIPYSVVVAQLVDQAPPAGPGPGVGPGPGPGPDVNGPEVVETLLLNATASNGAPLFLGNMINLRGLVETIAELQGLDPATAVTSENRLTTFAAFDTNNNMVVIERDGIEELWSVRVGGTPVSANRGFERIDGSWYVSRNVFTTLFGFGLNPTNGAIELIA